MVFAVGRCTFESAFYLKYANILLMILDYQENISSLDLSISALSHLLEACSTVPQYFTSVAVPEGYLKPSIWLKGVSAALLDIKVSKSKAAWLKCFGSLLIISPTIIDSDILQLIKIALLNISVVSFFL